MASNDTPGTSGQSGNTLNIRGLVLSPGKRLPSLRGPRDLTLGGATKRTFAPTIPVRKTRNAAVPGSQAAPNFVENKSPAMQIKTERGRGRGRGRGKHDIIQMASTFGDIGTTANTARHRGRGGGGGGDTQSDTSYSVVKKYDGPIMTKLEQEEYMKKLLDDNFISDGFKEESSIPPTILPLQNTCNALKTEPKPVTEAAVKDEPMDVDDELAGIKKELGIKTEVESPEKKYSPKTPVAAAAPPPVQETVADLFQKINAPDKDQLLFFQLPDCVPGLPLSTPEECSSKGKQANESTKASQNTGFAVPQDTKSQQPTCNLGDISEGSIGKLHVHESGKVTLKLGNVVLNVELGTQVGFLQDVMSLDMSNTPGNLTVLGQTRHRILCLPDVNHMFAQT